MLYGIFLLNRAFVHPGTWRQWLDFNKIYLSSLSFSTLNPYSLRTYSYTVCCLQPWYLWEEMDSFLYDSQGQQPFEVHVVWIPPQRPIRRQMPSHRIIKNPLPWTYSKNELSLWNVRHEQYGSGNHLDVGDQRKRISIIYCNQQKRKGS